MDYQGICLLRRNIPTRVLRLLRIGFATCLLVPVLDCSSSGLHPGFVFTQSPASKGNPAAAVDLLDLRYPAGSRVILADSEFKRLQVLSGGLFSAGDPQVTCDGKRVLFCAKATSSSEWQIYETELGARQPRPLTIMPGGAANPALLPDGRLLFISPVAKTGDTPTGVLYSQGPGEQPKALTFTSVSVSDPTVLEDGRILFVGTRQTNKGTVTCGLYTINNDGTEISEFSRPEDRPGTIRRPRQVDGTRILYLVSQSVFGCDANGIEFIRCARPFAAPERLSIVDCDRVGSVERGDEHGLVVSAATGTGAGSRPLLAVYAIDLDKTDLSQALFTDPAWDSFEVIKISAHSQPMGRLSTVDTTKSTGEILCLNVNYTSYEAKQSESRATRVRVVAEPAPGKSRVLGEVPVQTDGSFMAEVPADMPLGLEALDDQGHLLRRVAPMIWVRPGENRACIGCHEPPNHAPSNHRPLAVRAPVPRFTLDTPSLTQAKR
jgi:Tol biopolymer transport system component